MTAVIFPGQGSQYLGMAKDFNDNFKISNEIFEEIEDYSNINIRKIIFLNDDNKLDLTKFTQICIFSTSYVIFRTFCIENNLTENIYNVGTGKDIKIKELAEIIKKVTGYQGKINWDASKPDGTPRKLMDVSKMKDIGWSYSIELEEGIKETYNWFLKNIDSFKEIKL